MSDTKPAGYQWYFAYGSNNSYEQLLRRLGNVSPTANLVDQGENGGVHNTIMDTEIYPPLAIKVVLLPYYYFVNDAPSAIAGLGYANLRQTGDENDVAAPITFHSQDEYKSSTELFSRTPYVVSVAYLLSDQQLLMMDKFENAPDKYRRQSVRGVELKNVSPLPQFERRPVADCLAGSPVMPDSNGSVVCVPRDPFAREASIRKVVEVATLLNKEIESQWGGKEGAPEQERRFRERYFESLIQQLLLEGGESIACEHMDNPKETISKLLQCNSPQIVDGIAYIYEGNGLLHTDVNPNGADPEGNTAVFPYAVNINNASAAASVGIQPSSSYMGRILEGDYFFGLNEENASSQVANSLLAAYVYYLHYVVPSQIPSPRTLLRAAGKV